MNYPLYVIVVSLHKICFMEYSIARRLAEIIVKVRFDRATDQEREMLLCWLDESEANRQTYKNIITGETMLQRLKLEEKILENTDMDAVCRVIVRRLMRKEMNKKLVLTVSIAAGCIVLFMTGWLITYQKTVQNSLLSENSGSKVKLIMESGDVIGLDKEVPDSIDASAAIIVHDAKGLVYQAKLNSNDESKEEVRNKIITEVGGEYSFILSDGTKVWLNALSEIEFPVSFKKNERIVNLKGEAYFEVKPDSNRPFIVHSLNQTIRVLGTSFNIKAYDEDSNIYTTLIEGKLSVGSGGKSVLLSPGMESVCHKASNEIVTQIVNTDFAIAWRSGYFLFNNEDLDEMLKVLSRWYGVIFIYDKPSNESNTFSGRFNKYGDISTTLNTINLAGGPSFTIDSDGKRVHIIP